MLSRVADSLYWMSRYLERAEHIARQLDVHLNLVLDQGSEDAGRRRNRIVACLTDNEITSVENDYEFVQVLTFEPSNNNSLSNCIALARENARQIREQINSLMFEQINQLYLKIRESNVASIWENEPHEFYHSINEGIYLVQGMTDSRMSHDQGWQFIRVGQYVERVLSTASLVACEFDALFDPNSPVTVNDQQTYLDWVGLLRGCAAFEAYSKVYTANVHPLRVAEFLVLNAGFPHSVRFAVHVLQESLGAIAVDTTTRKGSRVNRLAGRLDAMLDYAQIDEVMHDGLSPFLSDIQERCYELHEAIYQTYINYPIEEKLIQA